MGRTEHQRQRLVASGAQAKGALKPAWVSRCHCPPSLTTPSSAGAQGRPQDKGQGGEGLGRVHTYQPQG